MISRLLFPLLFCLTLTARAQDSFDPFAKPGEAPAAAEPAPTADPVKASLVAEQTAIVPGQKFSVGLKLVHEEHWHTFWRNPGQFAQTPVIQWTLPEGVKEGQSIWGVPMVKDAGPGLEGAVQYIFEGHSLVITELSAPPTLKPGEKVVIALKAKLQACKEQCIPQTFELSLEVPVAEKAEPGKEAADFAAVRKVQPQATAAWKTSVSASGTDWTIRAEPGEGAAAEPGKLYFFDAAAATEATPQEWKKDGAAYTVTLTGQDTKPAGQKPWGYITAEKSWTAAGTLMAIPAGEAPAISQAAVQSPPADKPAVPAVSSAEEDKLVDEILSWGVRPLGGEGQKDKLTWPFAILFAFLGGMILNLMPCVFPVLGIKILGFVSQAGEDHSIVKKHGLAYAAGVILSVILLTAVLLFVRAGSESVGWGFQLQNPWFLTFLIMLVFAFSLSMAGLFEVGARLTGVGAELQNESGYRGSFFSGLLTVLLATPCTGPFMGPALGFALSAETPYWLVVAIFLALGVGLALPYVVLSWFPALVKKLPRPGAWMETFKQFMAFPMFATVVWLLYVYAGTTGRTGVTMMLFALTLLAMALWLYGRFFQRTAKVRSRTMAALTGLLCLIGGGYLAMDAGKERAPATASGHEGSTPLSAQLIIKRREQGLTTVVDLWAEWCLQCELNRKAAFDRKEFHDALPGYDAIFMLGDKSQEGSEADRIAQKFVKAYKSGGIPYAFIVPPKGPVIELPSVIPSPALLLKGLEEAKRQQ